MPATVPVPLVDRRHPEVEVGRVTALYVWPYPMRLFHWGMVISIGVLSFTGYYIHNPFIVGQLQHPFLAAWFRFTHEAFGMAFIALFLMRIYLFFAGNRWMNWREYVPLKKPHFQEMIRVMKFYMFLTPKAVSKIGHNRMAALSYIGIYALIALEMISGLVMFNVLRHSSILGFLVGWIPRFIALPELRLLHFFLMFVFIAFAIFHIHLAMLISREERRGLMDSIFIGYKVIPDSEIKQEERRATEEAEARKRK